MHETSRGRFEFNTMFILCTCTGMMTQLCSLRLTNFWTLILRNSRASDQFVLLQIARFVKRQI